MSDFQHLAGDIAWPASPQRLTLVQQFNQPIAGVSWPDALQENSFLGHTEMATGFPGRKMSVAVQRQLLSNFNQRITEVGWPSSLSKATFGCFSTQPVAGVAWPAPLRELAFSRDFSVSDERLECPASVQQLTIACRPHEPLPSWPGVQVTGMGRRYWES